MLLGSKPLVKLTNNKNSNFMFAPGEKVVVKCSCQSYPYPTGIAISLLNKKLTRNDVDYHYQTVEISDSQSLVSENDTIWISCKVTSTYQPVIVEEEISFTNIRKDVVGNAGCDNTRSSSLQRALVMFTAISIMMI
ncbi:hypothetical protein EB796_025244 [Bugula neritina]|uniref:Uncharacterized protein n=1 Tax=Bugula neritina TaxID=10212 RepID=A0A7J7ISA1_BUGNE|nr:hypothetical protein EB796_025244 [Bugula neritina]